MPQSRRPQGSRSPQRRQPQERGQQRPQEAQPIWGWPLPEDLRQALGGDKRASLEGMLKQIHNPVLLLQRYLTYPKPSTGREDAVWCWELNNRNYKNQAWKAVEQVLKETYTSTSSILAECLTHLKTRNDTLQADLRSRCSKTQSFSAQVAWRLAIGLGLPNPLEVGITLHHLYGFPYLPGSAIKGVTRSWQLQQVADKLGIPRLNAEQIHQWKNKKHHGLTPWECLEQLLMSPVSADSDSEERKRQLLEQIKQRRDELHSTLAKNELKKWKYFPGSPPQLPDENKLEQGYIRDFSRAFGSTKAKGEIIFFDAYPESLVVSTPEGNKPILELDVMNPHYGEYYTGDHPKPPADWLSPVPVFFLALRQGTSFIMRLTSRDQNLLGTVEGWVKTALQESGIGAKTHAGYGELCEPSSRSASAGPVQATAAVDPSAQLEASIACWKPSQMGLLSRLIESITHISDVERRRQLAQQLRQKLKEAGMWTRNYQTASWYRALENLLEVSTNATTTTGRSDQPS